MRLSSQAGDGPPARSVAHRCRECPPRQDGSPAQSRRRPFAGGRRGKERAARHERSSDWRRGAAGLISGQFSRRVGVAAEGDYREKGQVSTLEVSKAKPEELTVAPC